ncbi:MAG: hypothetical protein AABY40_04090 [Nanoarchaeota archaeon]
MKNLPYGLCAKTEMKSMKRFQLAGISALCISAAFPNQSSGQEAQKTSSVQTESAKAANVDTTRTVEDAVARDYFSARTGYGVLKVNDRIMQEGIVYGADTRGHFPINRRLSIVPSTNFWGYSYFMKYDNATGSMYDFQLSLETRVKAYDSKSADFYISLGTEGIISEERIHYKNSEIFYMRSSISPKLTLGVESPHFDITSSFSEHFGSKKTSYEQDRDIRMERVRINLLPRLDKFSLPTGLDIQHWEVTDTERDRHNVSLKSSIEPTLNVYGPLAASLFSAYTHTFSGEDVYDLFEVGMGIGLRLGK